MAAGSRPSRLLGGAAEVGPDGVARGSLPNYADIFGNNGVSRDAIDRLLADVAGNRMTNFDAWVELKSLNGFVDLSELGPTHLILLGDKNDANASPVAPDGTSNPYFSLENLLSYHIAGDHRADENVALTAVHTVWHREHNFQVERIKGLHPEWGEDQVFQTAKIIQTAEHQRVVFTEFAAAMYGPIPGPSHGFSGYNPNVNPGISDEFAAAMYRVGHSMINETIPFTDSAGHTLDVPLFSAFLNPAMFDGKDPLTDEVGGAAAIIAGELQVAHQRIDPQVVEVIHSELFGTPSTSMRPTSSAAARLVSRHSTGSDAMSTTPAALSNRPAKPRTMPRPCPRRSRALRHTRHGQSSGSTCAGHPRSRPSCWLSSRPCMARVTSTSTTSTCLLAASLRHRSARARWARPSPGSSRNS